MAEIGIWPDTSAPAVATFFAPSRLKSEARSATVPAAIASTVTRPF
jgi:hypothetical protein